MNSEFHTHEESTKGKQKEASTVGFYARPLMGRNILRRKIVTILEILEKEARLDMPLSIEM